MTRVLLSAPSLSGADEAGKRVYPGFRATRLYMKGMPGFPSGTVQRRVPRSFISLYGRKPLQ